jgi:hypothetical protein
VGGDHAVTEYLLYLNASEESPLWELASGAWNYFDDDFVTIHPALSRDVVADALLLAIERGDMTLYDIDDAEKASLAQGEAIRVIRDPAYYVHDTAPATICVCLTDAGEKRWSTIKAPEFERRPRN